MLTSIIIATHNRAQLVSRAIQSALDFGPPESEVIVVNDGSKDDTQSALKGFEKRIQAIHLPVAGGRSKARNCGIAAARGQFVAFLDDDDWFLPGALVDLETALRGAPETVVMAYGRPQYVCIQADGQVAEVSRELPGIGLQGSIVSSLIVRNFIQLGTVMARKEAVLQVGAFRKSSEPSEDWALWFALATRGEAIFVDRYISQILRHEGNTQEALFFYGKLDYLLSEEFRSFTQRLLQSRAEAELRAVSSVLLRFAAGCQHREEFSQARRLMALYQTCGNPYPLFTQEQLWRSWIPRFRRRGGTTV